MLLSAVMVLATRSISGRAGHMIPAMFLLNRFNVPRLPTSSLWAASSLPCGAATVAAAASGRRRTRLPQQQLDQHEAIPAAPEQQNLNKKEPQPLQQQQQQQQPRRQRLQQRQQQGEEGSTQTTQHGLDQLWGNAAQLGLVRASDLPPAVGGNAAAGDSAAGALGGTARSQGSSSSSSSTPHTTATRRRSSGSSGSSMTDTACVAKATTAPAAAASTSAHSSTGGLALGNPAAASPDVAAHLSDDEHGSSSASDTDELVEEEQQEQEQFGGSSDAVVAAVSRISRFLDFRERCASEVTAKLSSLGYSSELGQQVLAALQRSGLQNDARFAEMFVRSYWKGKAQSPARLAYELRSRGVDQQHIDAALAAVFGSGRQLPTSEAGSEQEEETWNHLVQLCKQRVELTRTEPHQKRRAKLAAWLQRRGHTMSTIFKIFEAVGI